MTVAQLIDQLQKFNGNTTVIGSDVSTNKDLEFTDVVSAVDFVEAMPVEGITEDQVVLFFNY